MEKWIKTYILGGEYCNVDFLNLDTWETCGYQGAQYLPSCNIENKFLNNFRIHIDINIFRSMVSYYSYF